MDHLGRDFFAYARLPREKHRDLLLGNFMNLFLNSSHGWRNAQNSAIVVRILDTLGLKHQINHFFDIERFGQVLARASSYGSDSIVDAAVASQKKPGNSPHRFR